MKTVTIPFDLKLAKKIQNGEVEGKIVDGEGLEYNILKWDAEGSYPLIGVYFSKSIDTTMARSFNEQGAYNRTMETVLDLQLEVPEYLTWNEGDYLTMESGDMNYVLIYKSYVKGKTNPVNYHVLFNMVDKELYFDSCCDDKVLIKAIRPSLTSEIELMHDLLRENGKRWNPETKQVEDVEKKPAHEFKPWDLCLARFKDTEPWCPVQFGYINNINVMISVGGLGWNKWIPYEGNEHLLGMINDPE
jgi:hypothetical protein